jgi:hypothetical protein
MAMSHKELVTRLIDPLLKTEAVSLMDEMDEDRLFELLESLVQEKSDKLLPFITAVFAGSQQVSNSSVSRFVRLYGELIQLLGEGTLSDAPQLIDLLFSNMRILPKEQAQQYTDKIIAELPQRRAQSGVLCLLELLPQLASLVGERCKDYAIDRLCGMVWPPSAVVLLSSALVELNSSHTKDFEVIKKISSSMSLRSQAPAPLTGAESISIEDLPSLVYQLTSIASDSAPPNVRRMVVEAVADSLDDIAEYVLETNLSQPSRGTVLRQVMSTIIHHLALLVSKDQVSLPFCASHP